MSNEFFKQITWGQRGDYIFWIAEALPIFLWGFLISKYYLAHRKDFKQAWVSTTLLALPVIGILINLWMSTWDAGPSVPRAWDFCLTSKVKPEDQAKGVLAYYNYDCYYQQNQDMRSSFNTYTDRMYYINYVLFFMIIMVQEHYKTPTRGRKIKFPQGIVNLLCIAGILGVVSSLIPLFTGNAIPTYIALKFFSGILWMSCTILVIFLVDMYFFVNKS